MRNTLKLKLHPEKSRIIPLDRGIDFVGFRNFYYHRLLRKRGIRNIQRKIELLKKEEINYEKFIQSFQGFHAYAKWSDSYNLLNKIFISPSTLQKNYN